MLGRSVSAIGRMAINRLESIGVDHAFGHAPINDEVGPVDKVVFRLTQKEAGSQDIFWTTNAPRGVLLVFARAKLLVILALNPAGADGIYSDACVG